MEQITNEALGPKRLKKSGKKPLVIIGVILAAAIAAYVGLCAYASSLDTFFRGYEINGVDVGGLTVTQAQEKLERELPTQEIEIYDAAQPEEPLVTVTLSDLGLDAETILHTVIVSSCFSYDQLLEGLSYFGDNYEKIVEIFSKLTNEKYGLHPSVGYFDCIS